MSSDFLALIRLVPYWNVKAALETEAEQLLLIRLVPYWNVKFKIM